MRFEPRRFPRDPTGKLAHVGRLALRLHLAAVDSLEVEHVVDEAVHAPDALLDHLIEALDLLVRELEFVATTKRLHRADDPRERPLEVVRDRVQYRVLHVVQLPETAPDRVLAVRALALARDH